MIVNTAYIYMGGGAAVNPNLWQDGVANYPVEFTDSSLSADGLLLKPHPTTDPAATFSELQLTNFTNFELSGNNLTFVDIGIKIEFFDSSDQLLGTGNATFSRGTITKTVAVPIPARIKNAKIKITNTSNSSITIISAVLT